jgi:PTH1 family peptidyl-tRNA hydrolase
MLLLAGLGNPGRDYAGHRHNVGFMAVDSIASRHGFGPWKKQFKAETAEGFLDSPKGRVKTLLLKPQTYMNLSGEAVQAAAHFYKIDLPDIAVLYDELDLAAGKIRVKTGGGAAGHNGIRSIAAIMGENFRRIRIGIDHPGDKARVTGHVLGNFSKDDQAWLVPTLEAIADAAPYLAAGDDNGFMNKITALRGDADPRKDKPKAEAPKAETPAAPAAKPKSTSPFAGLLGRLTGKAGDGHES